MKNITRLKIQVLTYIKNCNESVDEALIKSRIDLAYCGISFSDDEIKALKSDLVL